MTHPEVLPSFLVLERVAKPPLACPGASRTSVKHVKMGVVDLLLLEPVGGSTVGVAAGFGAIIGGR